ncbi:hypothetical protein GUITHDRAFT_109640 [Guillardia theta CCMP2712]|uniref:tRNA-binding domain-containing protein n=1 Tax=Guillardia theta (strain CCMP2712) TaxID=905079 RepID=L1J7L6_GUITC|nr:hypothetical protein GUITHDRAFT_109640 [Guillardia theta CCMP2712]EKX44521.1 hypothetical protein GUITHDRAFT_109640 [Guillardia theta CCMP2712]|eukprot:XP_005831501.1 hypothetical protein GUITHDRAFT_109640 [Guillardia theta CCMP2712]
MTRPVVTRFAPSPTGFGADFKNVQHDSADSVVIGGEAAAMARASERHDEGAVNAIIQGMDWLGCKHDGDIIRQSTRKARHKEVAESMIQNGRAYKCYCSKEELDALRAEAEAKKEPFRYPGTYRPENLPPDFKPPEGVEPVVRIRTDEDGTTGWDDLVQGRIDFPNKDVDDFIILRADGSPTYLLAVVVDDHDMEISHVIRGSDHISNTPRQLQIYKACGWEPPQFGHIPLIHGPDGQKLSKRHGATGVEQYEALGYLPEAMRNYLARLSWSHGNDEIFTTEQAIEWFTLDGCSKSPSCFDFDKLNDLNAHYIKECDKKRLLDIACKLYPELVPFAEKLDMAVDMLKPRAKTIKEYREAASFIWSPRPLEMEEKAAKNVNSDAAKQLLKDVIDAIKEYKAEWNAAELETMLVAFTQAKNLKLGQVAQPLRSCLTGSTASPGIYEVMWVIGKEECIGRIEDALAGKNSVKAAPVSAPAAPKEEKKEKKGGAAPAPAADQPEFTKLEIKVGLLTKTWPHPDSDKLFCEEIDVGEKEPRSVASGLRAFYSEAEFCAGRKVLVVTNLKPAKMAGFESAGMVLAASNDDHSKVELLEVPEGAQVGERVFIEGLTGEPFQPNQVNKKNVLKNVLPDLKMNADKKLCWQDKIVLTSAGPITVPTMANCPVG